MKNEPYHHKVTRYQGPDGRRCKSTDPGAVKMVEETDTYYGDLPPLPPETRPERVSLGSTDKGTAWAELRRRLKLRAREIEGIEDPVLGQARKPLCEHLADWLAEVAGRGTSAEQVKLLRTRVEKLAALGGWEGLPQITTGSATTALAALASEKARGMPLGYEGRGAQTRNHYLSALKQFVGWCLDSERLERDPLRRLRKLPVEADLRHQRRSPTDQEVGDLMAHLEGSGAATRCGMTGPQRALGYRLAMSTGFRAKELRSLRRFSFDLEAGTVVVPAGYSKRKRRDTQYLPGWLIAELRDWLADSARGLWAGFPRKWPGRLLLADQVAAGISHVVCGQDGADLYFDFHSLRHWYCTWAANTPGISPKVLLSLCRHSDPKLTLQTYAKEVQGEARRVVEGIPRLGLVG